MGFALLDHQQTNCFYFIKERLPTLFFEHHAGERAKGAYIPTQRLFLDVTVMIGEFG